MVASMKYVKIESADAIQEYLRKFDDCYPRLAKRVRDIAGFTKKLADNGIVIVYKASSDIKGVICYYENDRDNLYGYITIIWINKDNRGEGVGTKLLNYCITDMKKKGMKAVRLEVKTENKKAISFYRKNGFIIQNVENNSCYMVRML